MQNPPKVTNGSWFIRRKFYSKNKALSFEYRLKKDRNERLKLINDFKKNKESKNSNCSTL